MCAETKITKIVLALDIISIWNRLAIGSGEKEYSVMSVGIPSLERVFLSIILFSMLLSILRYPSLLQQRKKFKALKKTKLNVWNF